MNAVRGRDFASLVEEIIVRHPETSLKRRWEEAQRLDPSSRAAAYWIRESPDIVNFAWIIPAGILDITWFPTRQMSTLVFLRISEIAGMEIREAAGAGAALGLPVSGDLVVTLYASNQRSSLVWVAEANASDPLRRFAEEIAQLSTRPGSTG